MNKNRRNSIIFGLLAIIFIIGVNYLQLPFAWQGGFVFSLIALYFAIKALREKKNKSKLLLFIIFIFTLLTGYVNYSFYTYSFEFKNGEVYSYPAYSQNKKYTAQAYYKTYGGAAGGVSMWVEVIHHNDNDRVETVYYSDAKSTFNMKWEDDETLYIQNEEHEYPDQNRSIELRIGKDIYDELGGACNTSFVKKTYENCYQN